MGENKSGKIHIDNNNNDNDGRKALGDVTNQLGNRGFLSSISKQLSGRKRVAENSNDEGDDDDDSRFWKQVSIVVDKLDKESGGVAKYRKVSCVSNEVGLSPLKGGKTYRLQTSSTSGSVGSTGENRGVVKVKEDFVSSFGCGSRMLVDVEREGGFMRGCCEKNVAENRGLVDVEKEGGFTGICCEENLEGNQDFVDVVNVEKEGGFTSGGCDKNGIEVGKECLGEETRGLSDVGENDCNVEELGCRVLGDNGKSMSESAETSRFNESREVRSFGLERCTLLKGDGSNSSAAGVDLVKNCSCSFCTKAAYIWSDLQCQDVKGRISTLAKSQREASKLAHTHTAESATGVAQGNSSTAPHLETGLKTLWKSLFLHMENNFAAESSQLQSNFAVLKNIREDYKLNLEIMNAMPPDIQQSSSDLSDRSYDEPGS